MRDLSDTVGAFLCVAASAATPYVPGPGDLAKSSVGEPVMDMAGRQLAALSPPQKTTRRENAPRVWRPANGVACLLAPTVVGRAYVFGGGTSCGGGGGRRAVMEKAGALRARATEGDPGL